MRDEDKLEECLRFMNARRWTWFVTLRYPGDPRKMPKDSQEVTPFELVQLWLEAIDEEFRGVFRPGSVCIREQRYGLKFQVLLNVVPEESRAFWRSQWRLISGEGSWDRRLYPNMTGFYRYLVKGADPVECRSHSQRVLWCPRGELSSSALRSFRQMMAKRGWG